MQKVLQTPEGFNPPYLPLTPRIPPSHHLFDVFSHFLRFFRMQKNVEKTSHQKTTFFALFLDFGSPRRRFLAIFNAKTDPRRLLFRCFFENGDFVKIVLPLWK